MRTRSGVSFSTVMAMLLLAAAAAAAGHSWETGLTAFEGGDFETALDIFQGLRVEGLDGPAVHYNIAVCEYKTGRYRDAEATFTLIRDRYPKFAGLADYNLGLVARKLDRQAEALAYFRAAYDAGDEKLRAMAAEMIYRLTPEPVPIAPRGYAGFGIRAGYDDNVALRDELGLPAGTTAESPLFDAYLAGELPLTDSDRLSFDGAIYAVRYTDTPEFDQDVAEGGLSLGEELGAWRVELGIHGSYGTLAGDNFDRGLILSTAVDRRISGAASVRLAYEHRDVSAADDLYAGIEGTRERVEARYRWASDAHRINAVLRFETNDRLDPGVSPERMGVRISWRILANETWSYDIDAGWRTSDYDRLSPVRSEDRTNLRLGATRMLGDDWMVSLFYEYAKNDSSDPVFTYERNRLTIGVQRVF